ncbi:MAG: hypothetical protein ACOYEN_01740 [Limnochordia bacterium]|nr:hypothetical protein [Limnochordia bacterium]
MRRFVMLMLTLLLAIGLVGCDGAVKIGWVSNSYPGTIKARFRRFDGTESQRVRAKEGEYLSLSCSADLERGSISVSVVGPDKATISTIEAGAEETTTRVDITRTGTYRIVVTGEGAQGNFHVTWRIEDGSTDG